MSEQFDLIVRGGQVADGLGNALKAADVAVRDGRIKPGHVVMIEAVGGGFTWGAAIIRW